MVILRLKLSTELSELRESYHALSEKFEAEKTEMLRERTDAEEKLRDEITTLQRDSDDICGELELNVWN